MSGNSGSSVEQASDPETSADHRIRMRAYHLWEESGRPQGQDLEFWERARELEGIAGNPGAGLLPIDVPERVDEAALQDNLGEFPDRLADQGEHRATPMTRAQEVAKSR